MTPTNELRFVERESYSRNGEHFATPHTIRVLQQKWIDPSYPDHPEWRDVPLVNGVL